MSNYTQRNASQQVFITIQAIVILGLLVVVAYLIGLFGNTGEQSRSFQIIYKVNASGGQALVTYTQADGSKSESQMVRTPWNKAFTFRTGDVVYLTAGNPTEGGDINCQIIQDGVVKDEDENTFADKAACALRIY